MPQKVMRYQIADYLGITPPGGVLAYHLMGVGVTKMDESPSPKTNTDAYVNSKNGVTTVTGYDNSFPYDTQMISDDEAVKALVKVGHDQLIGSDAEFEYVRADLYDRVESQQAFAGDGAVSEFTVTAKPAALKSVTVAGVATTAYTYDAATGALTFTAPPASEAAIVVTYYDGTVYRARKFHVCCEAGDISGDPTDIVQTSGTLHQVGDFTPGTFDVTEKTFTAD